MNSRQLAALLLCGALLAAPAAAQPDEAKRQEKAFVLDNGIKVLLVSDPSVDRSAAALSVNVGSMNDGQYPGIAHFLEHMLFLGTKKYPKAGDYKDYLSANDGSSNAYTAYDHTNYFFEVKPEAYEGALDRFSRFFIDPLFTDELAGREVNAVDSEHSKNLEDEYWRARQVYRSNLNPKHPHCNFATGSKGTLGGVKNQTLVTFYKDHYSSNIMNLVLVSNHPVAKLEGWARAMFAEVPNRGHKALKPTVPLFHEGIAGHRVDIKSLKDIRDLWLRFEVPPQSFDYESKSHAIVGFVLGHEGQESLLQQLKEEDLATSLSAGGRQLGDQGTFNLTLTLTPKGLANVDLVLERIFGQINMMRGLESIPEQLIAQEQKMSAINLRFRQVGSASSEAQNLAASMINVPHDNLLENTYLVKAPDQEKIRALLEALRPENAVVAVLHKGAKTDKVEPNYNCEYALAPLGDALVAKLKAARPVGAMGLPAANAFIPTVFELVEPKHAETPYVYETEYGEVWLRHDTTFNQPKAALQIEILNDDCSKDARGFILGQLLAQSVNEALNPYTYPMTMAGVSVGISAERGGVGINAGGYNDKLPELLAFIVPYLKECKIDEARFETIRKANMDALRNFPMQPAQGQAVQMFRNILREVDFTPAQQLEALEKLSFKDLQGFFQSYRDRIAVRGFVYGNMTPEQVRGATDAFIKALEPKSALPKEERYEGRVILLKPGTSARVVREIDGVDSCTLLLYQHDELTEETRACLNVMNQIMPNRFYQDLRTLQQTGYIVGGFCFEVEDIPLFGMLAQSSGYSTSSLRGRFESFLKHLPGDLEKELTDEEFETFKGGAIAQLTRTRKTFGQELAFNFDAAFERNGDFDYEARQVAAIKALDKATFLKATRAFFSDEGVRRISVEVQGRPDRQRFQTTDAETLRKGASYHKSEPKAQPKPAKSEGEGEQGDTKGDKKLF